MLNRHPWLFTGAIRSIGNAQNGDIVEVRSSKNELLGYGHFNNHSQIICRIFEFTDAPQQIDEDYWRKKIDLAYNFRDRHIDFGQTNGYRLINAEGDHFPGVIVDRYNDTAVMQLRTPGTGPLNHLLAEHLQEQYGIRHIYDKSHKGGPDAAEDEIIGWITPEPDGPVQFKEHQLNFLASPGEGQKTGYYLDQRENRGLVGKYAEGRTVLDSFTYAGGFGAHALRGGAREVISVDASETAIDLCKANVRNNFGATDKHRTEVADCFDYLRNMPEGKFDCIVLDPPAFTKHISTVKKATRGYKDINLNAMRKIRPGGLLFTFSCSQHISKDLFRKVVFSAAADAGRKVRIIDQVGQPIDHPVDIFHPEGEYLKGLVLSVD